MDEVNVTIKYLVNFRELTGKSREEVSFESGTDLEAVAAWLSERYGFIIPSKGMMTLLNGHGWNQYPEKTQKKLSEGDVIIIMPTISGG